MELPVNGMRAIKMMRAISGWAVFDLNRTEYLLFIGIWLEVSENRVYFLVGIQIQLTSKQTSFKDSYRQLKSKLS